MDASERETEYCRYTNTKLHLVLVLLSVSEAFVNPSRDLNI